MTHIFFSSDGKVTDFMYCSERQLIGSQPTCHQKPTPYVLLVFLLYISIEISPVESSITTG